MRVKLLRYDDSPFFYSARTTEIKTAKKTMYTPTRAQSNGDLNAKALVPTTEPLRADVAGVSMRLEEKAVTSIMTENDEAKNLIIRIENYRQRMQHSSLIIPSIQPASKCMDEVLKSESNKEEFLRKIIRVQEEANLDLIGVPWVDMPKSRLGETFSRIAEGTNREPVFFIDLGLRREVLDEAVKHLRDLLTTNRIHFIGVLWRPVTDALSSYDYLWKEFKDKDVAFVLSHIRRYDDNLDSLSYPHLNEFILGDILLPIVLPGRRSKKRKEPAIDTQFRIFDRNELTVRPIVSRKHGSWKESVLGELTDPRVELMLENYREADTDDKKRSTLMALSKVHEFISSTKEFESSRKYIENGETSDYVKSKSLLKKNLQATRGK